ncbi:hypothetical protein GCM10028862_17360 [Luteimonas pelagia]
MRTLSLAIALAFLPALSACAESPDGGPASQTPAPRTTANESQVVPADDATAVAGAAPTAPPQTIDAPIAVDPSLLVVHKNPSCGCCGLWVEHMHAHGFPVDVREIGDMGPVKERLGVPPGMGSCHTAEIGGYFIEGHVPAEDVRRLLAERPEARGLTVPGMPLGSPGMEVPDGRTQPYEVLLVAHDGSTTVWSRRGR